MGNCNSTDSRKNKIVLLSKQYPQFHILNNRGSEVRKIDDESLEEKEILLWDNYSKNK